MARWSSCYRTVAGLAAGVLLYGAAARPVPAATTLPRIKALKHLGSFTLSREWNFGGPEYHGFSYGGTALGYNPVRNSLFIVGHSQDQLLAEVSIPNMGGVAKVLQNLSDPTAGRIGSINPTDPNSKIIGGSLVYGSKLIVTAYSYYDGNGTQVLSHFVRPADLSSGTASGPLQVGPLNAGFYSGYMGLVPEEWRAQLGGPALTGNAALAVVGRTSFGPAVFSFDPDHLSTTGAQPLVYYPQDHQTLGPWAGAGQYYGGSDQIKGVLMVPGSSSLLFFGRHASGFCYGPGTNDRSMAGKPSGAPDERFCYDPTDGSKGTHGYPYAPFAWAYDAQDLAAVHAGTRKPWDVVPYAGIVLREVDADSKIGGATIDPATGRIYVSELNANPLDRNHPVIHVYSAERVTDPVR